MSGSFKSTLSNFGCSEELQWHLISPKENEGEKDCSITGKKKVPVISKNAAMVIYSYNTSCIFPNLQYTTKKCHSDVFKVKYKNL